MTRIAPLNYDYDYDIEGMEGVCPRYIKWIKRVKAFDFSKPKKVTIERKIPTFNIQEVESIYHSTPVKSHKKNVFSRLRRSGKNFKVRCKTSADLWRRWISGDNQNESDANLGQTISNVMEANNESNDTKDKMIDIMVNNVDKQTNKVLEKRVDDARVVNSITIVETGYSEEQSTVQQNDEIGEQIGIQIDDQTMDNKTDSADSDVDKRTNEKVDDKKEKIDEKEIITDDQTVALCDDNTDNKIIEQNDNETIIQNEEMPTNNDTEPIESEQIDGMASLQTNTEEEMNMQTEKQAFEELVEEQTCAQIEPQEDVKSEKETSDDAVEAITNDQQNGSIEEQTEGQSSERREEQSEHKNDGQAVDIDNDIDIAEFTKSILLNL